MHTESPPSDVPVLRRAAMDFLVRREHSFYELSQKLLGKFPDASAELIEQVLIRLKEQNLQSDERFTEAYVRYRKSKGFAYLHIKSDLVQRKVPMAIINAYLYEDDADWPEIALGLISKRLGDDGTLEYGSSQHRRLAKFLESRGFSQLDTRRVLALKLN
jgi:regulatory protein